MAKKENKRRGKKRFRLIRSKGLVAMQTFLRMRVWRQVWFSLLVAFFASTTKELLKVREVMSRRGPRGKSEWPATGGENHLGAALIALLVGKAAGDAGNIFSFSILFFARLSLDPVSLTRKANERLILKQPDFLRREPVIVTVCEVTGSGRRFFFLISYF